MCWRTLATVRAVGVALFGVLALAGTLPSEAGAFVYWVNNGSATIGRANLDGTNVDQSFITGATPCGVAVDGAHIYWGTGSGNTIGRANLDGTGANQGFITSAGYTCAVAVDGAHVYWISNNDIGRANLDGTGPDPTFIAASLPCGVAVDGAHVYWTINGATIGRANLNGTSPDPNFITGVSSPCNPTVDSAHIYWSNGTTMGRANLDGSSPNTSFLPVSACGLAVDAVHIFWGEYDGNTIGRVNLDGTGLNHSLISGANKPCGVAVDALSSPVSTTTTTLPPVEICGDCLDDDGDGLTDFEDPDCCTGMPATTLTLKKGLIKPVSGATKLALKATVSKAGLAGGSIATQDVFVQLRAQGGEVLCAHVPASAVTRKKTRIVFKDPAHGVATARGVDHLALSQKKNGSGQLNVAGAQVTLTPPPAGHVDVVLGLRDPRAGDAGNLCANGGGTFRAGRKGLLKFP